MPQSKNNHQHMKDEKIIIAPEVLITELAQIEKKSFLTCSEIYQATYYVQKKLKMEKSNWILSITQYSIERTLRYYYNSFEPINDLIVIKGSSKHDLPEYVYDYIHSALSNFIEEMD